MNTFTEPTWGIPQEALEPCSSFYLGGPSPFLLSGVFLRLLQYHFSHADNIEEPLLQEYIWTPSTGECIAEETTDSEGASQIIPGSRIQIRPSYSQKGPASQQPALYVKREAFSNERISFQDASLPGRNESGVYEGREYQTNIQGSHSIICTGGTGAEAELLGQEIFFRMLHYQPVIKKDFHLGSLMTTGVSEPRQRQETPKASFYTVVGLDWAYVYKWLVIPESPVIKRVAFEFR